MNHTEGKFPRLPVLLLGAAVGFSLLGDMAVYAILPVYHGVLGLSPVQVGILLSVNRWIRMLTNQLARKVLEQWSTGSALILSLLSAAVISGIYAGAPVFMLFLLARAVWGVCWSFIRHGGTLSVLGAGGPSRGGEFLGIYNGIVQLFFIIGTMASVILFDRYGYRTAFILLSAGTLAGIPFGISGTRILGPMREVFRPERKDGGNPPHIVQPPESTEGNEHEKQTRDSKGVGLDALFRGFVTTCVGTGLIISTLGFALKIHFGDSVSFGPAVVGVTVINGFLIAAHYGIGSAGSPVIGLWIDRVGRKRAELAAFWTGAAALAVAAVVPSPAVLLPAVVLFFIAAVSCKLSIISRAGLEGPVALARMMSASDLGAASGPLIGWIAIQTAGSPSIVFITGAFLFTAAALSFRFSGFPGTLSHHR